ncbi:MAG: VCBS domain-containing protein, partial [Alsobacter sp.]
DPDTGQAVFTTQTAATGSNGYGSFTLAADGTWTYTADATKAAIAGLAAGATLTDSFTAVSADGSASQLVTVTITGGAASTPPAVTTPAANTVAVIGGVATGGVTEDAPSTGTSLTAAGALTITDPDTGQAVFVAQTTVAGTNGHGSFTLTADGHWTYTADNTQAAIQSLAAGATLTDSFTAVSADGSASQVVTVTITGVNDAATIAGVAAGAVTATAGATSLTATGALTITDPDTGQAIFTTQTAAAGSNGYGSFTLAADGTWTYTADATKAAIAGLAAGATLTDSFTAMSADGSASQLVTVTITGGTPAANTVAVIGGVATGDVTEDAPSTGTSLTAAGALTITDPDTGQAVFVAQTTVAGTNGHGSFTLTADGHWTYTADNAQAAIQSLGAGATLTDSFTAVSADGSASQVVTVTITGVNDAATIGAPANASVTANQSVVGGNLVASGTLSISDPDTGEAAFSTVVQSTAGNIGSLTLKADGSYEYTVSNSSAQALAAGETKVDTFTVASVDGTTKSITFSVIGDTAPATTSSTVTDTSTHVVTSTSVDETLDGTSAADTFVFASSFGKDVVNSFVSGTDKLQFSSTLFASAADVLSHAVADPVTHDVVITLDASNTITLKNAVLLSTDILIT